MHLPKGHPANHWKKRKTIPQYPYKHQEKTKQRKTPTRHRRRVLPLHGPRTNQHPTLNTVTHCERSLRAKRSVAQQPRHCERTSLRAQRSVAKQPHPAKHSRHCERSEANPCHCEEERRSKLKNDTENIIRLPRSTALRSQ